METQDRIDIAKKASIVKRASLIALVGNIFIFFSKLMVAYLTSSLSILGDAIDSGADIVIAVMSLIVSFVIKMPQNKKYPYGKVRFESIASLVLSLIIIMIGLQLMLSSIKKLIFPSINGIEERFKMLSILVIISSIVLKLLLALNQFFLAKKAKSSIILANAKNMSNDVLLSSSVLIGISCTYYFNLVILDAIVATLIALLIIKSGFSLFWELHVELMDGNNNHFLYKKLFAIIDEMPDVYNPHRARIRKMAHLFDISFDIELDANKTLLEAHTIVEELTKKIKQNIENVYDVVIHMEPYGHINNEEEGFGLNPLDIKDE